MKYPRVHTTHPTTHKLIVRPDEQNRRLALPFLTTKLTHHESSGVQPKRYMSGDPFYIAAMIQIYPIPFPLHSCSEPAFIMELYTFYTLNISYPITVFNLQAEKVCVLPKYCETSFERSFPSLLFLSPSPLLGLLRYLFFGLSHRLSWVPV